MDPEGRPSQSGVMASPWLPARRQAPPSSASRFRSSAHSKRETAGHLQRVEVRVVVGEAVLGAVLEGHLAPRVPREHRLPLGRDDLDGRVAGGLWLGRFEVGMVERDVAEVALGRLVSHEQVVAVLEDAANNHHGSHTDPQNPGNSRPAPRPLPENGWRGAGTGSRVRSRPAGEEGRRHSRTERTQQLFRTGFLLTLRHAAPISTRALAGSTVPDGVVTSSARRRLARAGWRVGAHPARRRRRGHRRGGWRAGRC